MSTQKDMIVFIVKALGVTLSIGLWFTLVWTGKAPADGFVAGLLSIVGFLTGHAVGKLNPSS